MYSSYITKKYPYENFIELINQCANKPQLQSYAKNFYGDCCTQLAYENRIYDIKKMTTDELLSLRDVKNLAVAYHWPMCGMSQKVYELIDYDIPHIMAGRLTSFIYGPSTKDYFNNTAIDLIKGLHNKYDNFRVSQYAYYQAMKSKDILTIDYITKNKLCK
jgi:hypothetical protein